IQPHPIHPSREAEHIQSLGLSQRRNVGPTIGLRTALGQPLPSRDFCGTAALPLKPDIGWRGWHGRKVPESGHMLKFQKDVTERACLTHSVAICTVLRHIKY